MKTPHTFWIISQSAEGCDDVCKGLEELRGRLAVDFNWCVSVAPCADHTPPLPVGDLCGVIVVVDEQGLDSIGLAEVIRSPIATLADRDDFAVFAWLKDVRLEQVTGLAHGGNPVAVSLVENIHLESSMESLEDLLPIIQTYLETQLSAQSDFATFRRFTIASVSWVGWMATMLGTAMMILGSCGAILAISKTGRELLTGHPDLLNSLLVATLAGLTVTASRCLGLIDLAYCGSGLKALYPRFEHELIWANFAGLSSAAFAFTFRMLYDTKTFGLGFSMGVLLVVLERKGRRTRVEAQPFAELPERLVQGGLLQHLYTSMADAVVNSGAPLFEPMHKRVFISYSRSSAWSSSVAWELGRSLQDLGAFVFLDRSSLLPGRSWKRQLRSAIVDSNIFVVVLDENAAGREWIASEFAAAYQSKAIRRTPEIFVIHNAGKDFLASQSTGGVFFREIMVKPSLAIPHWMRSRMAPYDSETFAALCAAIRNYRIRGLLGYRANSVLSSLMAVVIPLCGLAEIFGLPLLVYTVWNRPFITSQPEYALLLRSGAAFLGGFSIRAWIFWIAELVREKDYSHGVGIIDLICALGFFGAVILCLGGVSASGLIVLVITLFLGLECGNYYAICTRTWTQQDNRIKSNR